ncbi:ty3-gypsy retrotransposon protein [Tanacetum coccineum]
MLMVVPDGDQFEFRTYKDPIGGSVVSLTGVPYPHTLRVTDQINGYSVVILIDGGSSHNFIPPEIARALQLPISPANSFPVIVGSGDHLHCKGVCLGIPLRIHDYSAKVDLYLLPIKGAELGLGVQWLHTIQPNPTYSLQDLSVDLPDILTSFTSLFSSVPRLPPHRETDHRIHLIPSTTPINVRPYRYPHYQNDIIEKMVSEVLTTSIIELGTSPFSSPVLLVRKKTGDWRFCVDYRALNEYIQKLQELNLSDPFLVELHKKLNDGLLNQAEYTVKDGLLLFKGKLLIDCDPHLIQEILREFNCIPVGGYSGVRKTMASVNQTFTWPTMKLDVTDFIKGCYICQRHKAVTTKPVRLLQPLPPSKAIWEEITIDFVTGLPPSHGATIIFVVVDRLSKQAHFGTLPTSFTASKVVELFAEIVRKLHGLP